MKMYPMQQKVFNEFQYCITCGKMVRVDNALYGEFHLIRGYYRGFTVCEGPFTSCPPPEEGVFLPPDDKDFEQEEPEPTYEDIEFVRHALTMLNI